MASFIAEQTISQGVYLSSKISMSYIDEQIVLNLIFILKPKLLQYRKDNLHVVFRYV